MRNRVLIFVGVSAIFLTLLGASPALAWTGATTTPPGGNTASPINTSSTQQTKSGDIWSTTSFVAPNVTANQFCISTNCITSWPNGGSGFTGSGSTNYLAKFTGAASLGNSIINDNGTTAQVNGALTVLRTGRAVSASSQGAADWSACFGSDCTGGTATQYGVYGNGSVWAGEFNGKVYITGNVGIGNSNPGWALEANGWVATDGATGWYNATYGGGWFMQDSTWIRSYNGKYLYESAGLDTGGPSGINCGGGLGGGYTFRVCGTQYNTDTLNTANGINDTGRINVTGPANDWAEVINWPPPSNNSYGLLVGATNYSQFQNNSGYYTQLDASSWGVYTNGNIQANDFYDAAAGKWMSQIGGGTGTFHFVYNTTVGFGGAAISASCPAGQVAISAGGQCTASGSPLGALNRLYPNSTTQWTASCNALQSTNVQVEIEVGCE